MVMMMLASMIVIVIFVWRTVFRSPVDTLSVHAFVYFALKFGFARSAVSFVAHDLLSGMVVAMRALAFSAFV